MTYPGSDFLLARRLLLAGASAFFALPALANLGPELLKGTLAKFQLAKEPKPLPELAFNDADDKPLKLADYKGKIVLLNFWATWCAPCVKEMPSLDRLQAEMGKDKFVVLPLSLDGPSRPKVAPFYKDKKLSQSRRLFRQGQEGPCRHSTSRSCRPRSWSTPRAASSAASKARPTGTSPRHWR